MARLFTDDDFRRVHALGVKHAGVVIVSRSPDFAAMARRIHIELDTRGDLLWGDLIRVNLQ